MYGAEPLRRGNLLNTITKLACKRVRQRRRDLAAWYQSTSRLTAERCRIINAEATVRGKMLPHDEAIGEDVPDVDPRAIPEL